MEPATTMLRGRLRLSALTLTHRDRYLPLTRY